MNPTPDPKRALAAAYEYILAEWPKPLESKTVDPATNFGRDEAEPTAEPPTPERADG